MTADAVLGVRCTGAELPGLGHSSVPLPVTHFRTVTAEDLEARWHAAAPGVAVHGTDTADGQPFMRVWRAAQGAFHVEAAGHGAHLLSADAAECVSYLPADQALARRLLAAQVLPLAATLHGREVLHAAGAVVGGHLVALSALSGTGKSTTLAHLLAEGADFFGDDTLGVQPGPGLLTHPGPPWLQLMPEVHERLPASGRERLGEAGASIGKLHFHLPTPPEPLPLAAFVSLRRDASEPRSRVVAGSVPAATLMRAPYIGYVTDPDRLTSRLDVLAQLADTVRCADFVLGADGPQAAAAALIEWVERGR